MSNNDTLDGPNLKEEQAQKMLEFCQETAAHIHLAYDGSSPEMRTAWITVIIMVSARIINDVLAITGQDAYDFGKHYVDELQKAVYAMALLDGANEVVKPT